VLWIPAVTVVAAIVAIAAVVVAHAELGHTKTVNPTALAGPSKPTPPPSPAPIALGDGRALLAHVVAPPAGAHEDIATGGTDGVFTIDQYVNAYYAGSSKAKTALTNFGFVVAAARAWSTSFDVVNVVAVQLRAPDGARGYFEDQRRAFVRELDVTGDRLIVGMADTARFEFGKPDATGRRKDVLVALDANLVLFIFVHRAEIDADVDVALLRQQFVDLARPGTHG